jgi:hypothetical protein
VPDLFMRVYFMELTDLQLPVRTPRFTEWDPAILDVLSQPLPEDLVDVFEDRRTGSQLRYIKWINIEAVLNAIVPGWQLMETREVVGQRWLHLYGYLDIYGVKRFNVGYWDKEAMSQIDGSSEHIAPATIARASLLRRCAADFGLGAYLYHGEDLASVPQVGNRYALRVDQTEELEKLLRSKDIPETVQEQLKAEKSWTIGKANKYIAYLRHRPLVGAASTKKPASKPASKRKATPKPAAPAGS